MPLASFRVEFAPEAGADLDAIENYWMQRGEAWRGEKYYLDLACTARRQLSDSTAARRGRRVENFSGRDAREILAFVYRIIYRTDEAAGIVNVPRFWHARRDEPRRGA